MPTDQPCGPTAPAPGCIATRHDFGRALTDLKDRAGLTVRDIAKATGIPASTIGGYFSGRHLPPVKPATLFAGILRLCGVTEPDAVQQWQQALYRVRRAPGPRRTDAPLPYRGLEAFQPEHAEWFHGREALTYTLVGRVVERQESGGLLVVVGASGAGKSSLLRAGLVPALGDESGSLGWLVSLFEPGQHPLDALTRRLSALTGADRDVPIAELLSASNQALTGDPNRRLVMVIDQFEETFTAGADEAERKAFITALATLAEAGLAVVVLGLRADFYSHALRYPPLVDALQSAQVVVGPMTEAELRRAIVEPANKARFDFEDGLVELLLRDLAPASGGTEHNGAYEAGALPLLAHALRATWERSSNSRMTVAAYQDSGSINGAIGRTADEVYDGLTHEQQDIARQLFVRLVNVCDDAADTRRRVRRTELVETYAAEAADGLAEVLARFVDQRLITAETETVQITHEALLVAWPRLRGWLDADRKGLIIQRQLTDAAHGWQADGRDPSVLYRGAHLAEARAWAKAHDRDIGALHWEFLQASVRAERRRTWQLTGVVVSLVVVLVASVLTAYQYRATTQQRREAIGRELVQEANATRDSDPLGSLLVSIKAYQFDPTPEALSSLLSTQTRYQAARLPTSHTGSVNAVAYHPDGHTLASAGQDGTIELWDASSHSRLTTLRLNGPVYGVAFSPDGTVLASAAEDGAVELWDVRTGNRIAILLGHTGLSANAVAFSNDGKTLASAHGDGMLRLWDLQTRDRAPIAVLNDGSGPVETVAFSPDGRMVVGGSADNKATLWDVASHDVIGTLAGHTGSVRALAFSPDGGVLATGTLAPSGGDTEVWLWDVAERRPIANLKGHTGSVRALAFSPDGGLLATGDDRAAVRLWDVGSRTLVTSLSGPTDTVTGLAFARDGRTLASASADATVGLWNVPTAGPAETTTASAVAFGPIGSDALVTVGADGKFRLWSTTRRNAHVLLASSEQPGAGPVLDRSSTGPAAALGADGSYAVAFSPDGRTVAGEAADGSITLWELGSNNPPRSIAGHRQPVTALAFSPDGRLLASASDDHTVKLWNPRTGAKLATLSPHTQLVNAVAFDPNGNVVATGGNDRFIRLSDVSTRAPGSKEPGVAFAEFDEQPAAVTALMFSPDGDLLASAAANTVTIWDTGSRQRVGTLTGHARTVVSVAFGPYGTTLASADEAGTVKLWDVGDAHRSVAQIATLTGLAGATAVAFSPDGGTLAGADYGGTAAFWDSDPDQLIARVCATLATSVQLDWLHSLPDGLPRDRICP